VLLDQLASAVHFMDVRSGFASRKRKRVEPSGDLTIPWG